MSRFNLEKYPLDTLLDIYFITRDAVLKNEIENDDTVFSAFINELNKIIEDYKDLNNELPAINFNETRNHKSNIQEWRQYSFSKYLVESILIKNYFTFFIHSGELFGHHFIKSKFTSNDNSIDMDDMIKCFDQKCLNIVEDNLTSDNCKRIKIFKEIIECFKKK